MKLALRKIALGLTAATVGFAGGASAVLAEFPEKPITILAYMKPGGAADIDSPPQICSHRGTLDWSEICGQEQSGCRWHCGDEICSGAAC